MEDQQKSSNQQHEPNQRLNSHDRKSSYESFESTDKNSYLNDEWGDNQNLETPFDNNQTPEREMPKKEHRNDFNDYEIDFDGSEEYNYDEEGVNYPLPDTSKNIEKDIDKGTDEEQLSVISRQRLGSNISFTENAYRDPEIDYQIHVLFDHNEGQIQNVVYYAIKGYIMHLGVKKDIEAKRRFSDFVFLYKLLTHKFYYKVLPLLPEKNKLLKIISNKETIDKRGKALENFIIQVINIEGALDYEPVIYFLFKGQEFQLLYEKSEYKEIINKEGLLENAKELATHFVQMVKGNQETFDRGYYSNFHKEVETLYLFTSTFIENLTKLENNTNTIFKNISGFVESSRKVIDKETTHNYESMSEILIKKYHNSKKNTQSFIEVLKTLKMVNEDLRACKESLDRKDSIHKEYAKIGKELQNENQRNNQMYVAKKYHLEALKQKIDTMEIDLKNDLTRHLHVVNKRLVETFRDKMQQVFIDLYKIN